MRKRGLSVCSDKIEAHGKGSRLGLYLSVSSRFDFLLTSFLEFTVMMICLLVFVLFALLFTVPGTIESSLAYLHTAHCLFYLAASESLMLRVIVQERVDLSRINTNRENVSNKLVQHGHRCIIHQVSTSGSKSNWPSRHPSL